MPRRFPPSLLEPELSQDNRKIFLGNSVRLSLSRGDGGCDGRGEGRGDARGSCDGR